MEFIETAPTSIQVWMKTQGQGLNTEQISEILANDVSFTFAGKTIHGITSVLERISSMPKGMASAMECSVIAKTASNNYTIRATGPNGAPMPSPGGLMSAIDFKFHLNDQQLIDLIQPIPHHLEPNDLGTPLSIGSIAGSFTLPDVYGKDVTFDPQAHKASVVLFTCNPCPWALGWHDRIQDVIGDYAEKNVQFLQINANSPAVSPKDAVEYSRKRVDQGDFAGPYLMDYEQKVVKQIGGRHTPDVFVFNNEGQLVYHGAPDEDYDNETLHAEWLRDGLDAALTGKQPALAETKPVGCTIKWIV